MGNESLQLKRCGGALVVCLGLCVSAFGQGRDSFVVGGLRGIGSQYNFGSERFRQYSFGLGSTSGGRGQGGILGNSISNPYSFNVAASSMAEPSRRASGVFDGGTRSVYQPLGAGRNVGMAGGLGGSTTVSAFSSFGAGDGVAASFSRLAKSDLAVALSVMESFDVSQTRVTQPGEEVTSFVPDATSQYADQLRTGEQAMKTGQYQAALERFRLANHLARRNPESLLSLAHANYALGKYGLTAHYLRRAIAYFPELPQARIRLRSFFRDSAEFLGLRDRLRKRIGRLPNDAALWFSLAYVEWFDGDEDATAEALRKAAQACRDPLLADAVEAFWEGCLTTRKITGELSPALPASVSSSQPAPAVNESPAQLSRLQDK